MKSSLALQQMSNRSPRAKNAHGKSPYAPAKSDLRRRGIPNPAKLAESLD
jgi:hypothetical protein